MNIIRELLDPCSTASSPLDNDMASPDVDNQTAVPEPPLEVLSPSDPTQNYVYNPRHMLCLMCFTEELSMRFWGWWLRERKLPPVSAPVQENCCLGFSCVQQRRANHARKMDVSLSANYTLPPSDTQFSTVAIRRKISHQATLTGSKAPAQWDVLKAGFEEAQGVGMENLQWK